MSEIHKTRQSKAAPGSPTRSAGSTPLPPPRPTDRPAAVTPDADGHVRLGRHRSVSSGNLTRRGRVRKWDREPAPHDWRFYVGNLGKTLIAVGLLMFGFVGYQLYGTGIETAAAQNQLEDEFEQQLALAEPIPGDFAEAIGVDGDRDVTTEPVGDGSSDSDADPAVDTPLADDDADPFTPSDEAGGPPAVPVAAQNIPADLENGDALARIEIPRIGVSDIVVAGVETGDLKRGPGHFPDTPLPGQLGNAAIAGHRTTYGQPFRNVDQLEPGDEIRMTTLNGVFVYRVTGQAIVEPSEYQVVATTDPTIANLTLTSCHPVFTARQRIVIFSELDRTESAPVGAPVINYGRVDAPESSGDDDGDFASSDGENDDVEATIDPGSTTGSGTTTGSLTDPITGDVDQLGTEEVNEGIADAFSEGWFSDPGANSQVGLWGLVLGAIALAAYAISRRFRSDLAGLAIGLIPFTLALYFFFQNVNRLLPPNL